ncbi:MAG TPA: DUF2249 domain-containing protein [Mycobacteriales bacterium]|nr:DUF2249 domain-containing protein [Mycobacteriales bacterium]
MTASVLAPVDDEHSVLLWQTCAYADDLVDAVRSGQGLTPAYDAMLEFLHYRLLPYLRDEERNLPPARLRDDHMMQLLLSDHDRLRADVDNIESSRTRRVLTLATDAFVDRLDRHVRREEAWIRPADTAAPDMESWALPLLLDDQIDVDALPSEHRSTLVRRRLMWLRSGETLRLDSGSDLHSVWQALRASDHDAYTWVYEEDGPTRWRARLTRRGVES